MGKTIEVRLSDAQYAALSAEAAASGQKFFEYCRAKLVAATVASPAQPKHPAIITKFNLVPELRQEAPAPPADDRIARIEDAVARLTEYVLQGQPTPDQAQPEQPQQPIDVDSLVDAQFAEAEAAGLTEHVPGVDEEVMQHAGVRPLSRRPMRFSANTAPRHLQDMLG